MKWVYHRRTRDCASLSCYGPYVVSHRPGLHIVSYRPTGKHVHVGEYQTWQAAKAATEQHARTSAKGPQRGRNVPTAKTV